MGTPLATLSVGLPRYLIVGSLPMSEFRCVVGRRRCEVRVTIVVIVVIVEVIVGLSLRAEVEFTEPNARYHQFSLDSLQKNVAIFKF